MAVDATQFNALTGEIIAAAIEVHRKLGPGLLESIYSECMEFELEDRRLTFEAQRVIPVIYKGRLLRTSYRVDLIVQNIVVVEVKAIAATLPVHDAQVLTYLEVAGCPIGLMFNFNVPKLVDGIRRFVNPRYGQRAFDQPPKAARVE